MDKIIVKHWTSPIGEMIIGSYRDELCLADWMESPKREQTDRHLCERLYAQMQEGTTPVIEDAIKQLDEYFRRERQEFDLSLRMVGTEFQERAWRELLRIPYGTTISYGEQARRMGDPSAVRAVANANSCNPVCIIVPCHRVIGANRTLTGYAGGLHLKRALLDLESATLL
ncbi:MAG: methylated-DNA--[protein]-cysteine S-methyltransferase [Bacteroidales bacterium]|nr:methylated-DNA--[protein]-cysteine S-methyltransferase [Bacteroidales bacterium]